MFLKIIDLALGNLGRFIRDFYFDHSMWINAVVVLYAIFITWTHSNLRSLYFKVEKLILELTEPDEKNFDWKKIRADLSDAWITENKGNVYLLPSMNDLWIEKIPAEEILDVFLIDENFIMMVIIQKRSYPANKVFSKEEFTVWKDYLHHMKRGLRSGLKNPATA